MFFVIIVVFYIVNFFMSKEYITLVQHILSQSINYLSIVNIYRSAIAFSTPEQRFDFVVLVLQYLHELYHRVLDKQGKVFYLNLHQVEYPSR